MLANFYEIVHYTCVTEQKFNRRRFRVVVAKVVDCNTGVNEFELQSCSYVPFRMNTLGKGKKKPYPSSYGLNNTTLVLLQG